MDLIGPAHPIRSRPWLGYSLAIALSLVSLLLRILIGDLLIGYPFLTFFSSILLAAHYGGREPGLFAAFMSGVPCWHFLTEPFSSFQLASPSGYVALALYAFVAGAIVWLHRCDQPRLWPDRARRGRNRPSQHGPRSAS